MHPGYYLSHIQVPVVRVRRRLTVRQMSGCSCVGKIGETPLNRRVGSIIASARYPLSTEREPEEIVPRWSDWPFLFVRVARYTPPTKFDASVRIRHSQKRYGLKRTHGGISSKDVEVGGYHYTKIVRGSNPTSNRLCRRNIWRVP